MKKLTLFIPIVLILGLASMKAQNIIEVKPLFEYPVAPENLESLEEKCDYIVKNFWNNFNFKSKEPVDQYALNEAFQVYATSFQFANEKEVNASIDKLIKNLSGNKVLLMQFGKAAEENLYGPRADFWSDGLYLKFVDAIIKDKKIPQTRKGRYIKQAQALMESKVGSPAPEFWFTDRERASKRYFPMSTPTLIIFGDPGDTDWRIARIRLDSNLELSEALKKGKINILYIVPGNISNWQRDVENYNPQWTIGQSDEAATHYDLRLVPSIYLIGSDGKILGKNLILEEAIKTLLEQIN